MAFRVVQGVFNENDGGYGIREEAMDVAREEALLVFDKSTADEVTLTRSKSGYIAKVENYFGDKETHYFFVVE